MAYRRLASRMQDSAPLPAFLERPLRRLDPDAEAPVEGDQDLIGIVLVGLVPPVREHLTLVWHPDLSRSVQLALPYYPPRSTFGPTVAAEIDGERVGLSRIEDFDDLARAALAEEMPAITARGLARLLVKRGLVKETARQHELAGLFANVAALATERADTRSWRLLPGRALVLRRGLAAGEHRVRIQVDGRAVDAVAGSVSVGRDRPVLLQVHTLIGANY